MQLLELVLAVVMAVYLTIFVIVRCSIATHHVQYLCFYFANIGIVSLCTNTERISVKFVDVVTSTNRFRAKLYHRQWSRIRHKNSNRHQTGAATF